MQLIHEGHICHSLQADISIIPSILAARNESRCCLSSYMTRCYVPCVQCPMLELSGTTHMPVKGPESCILHALDVFSTGSHAAYKV